MCLAEKKFVCKSATYNYESRICKLFDENRRTKPNVFKSTKMKMDYLENQCVKGKMIQINLNTDKLVISVFLIDNFFFDIIRTNHMSIQRTIE